MAQKEGKNNGKLFKWAFNDAKVARAKDELRTSGLAITEEAVLTIYRRLGGKVDESQVPGVAKELPKEKAEEPKAPVANEEATQSEVTTRRPRKPKTE